MKRDNTRRRTETIYSPTTLLWFSLSCVRISLNLPNIKHWKTNCDWECFVCLRVYLTSLLIIHTPYLCAPKQTFASFLRRSCFFATALQRKPFVLFWITDESYFSCTHNKFIPIKVVGVTWCNTLAFSFVFHNSHDIGLQLTIQLRNKADQASLSPTLHP